MNHNLSHEILPSFSSKMINGGAFMCWARQSYGDIYEQKTRGDNNNNCYLLLRNHSVLGTVPSDRPGSSSCGRRKPGSMKWVTCPRSRAVSALGYATVLAGSKMLGKHTYGRTSDADHRYQKSLLRGGIIRYTFDMHVISDLITLHTPSMNICADNFLFRSPAAISPFG